MINKILFLCSILMGIQLQANAQLTVANDNKVGIGVTSPVSELAVGGVGDTYSTFCAENTSTAYAQRAASFYKNTSGGQWSFTQVSTISLTGGADRLVAGYFYAKNATSLTSPRSYGILSIAGNGISGYNYGVWARLDGSNNGAALFATSGTNYEINTGGKYAGYFRGDVLMENDLEVRGTINEISDINLKKDIRPISDDEIKQIDKLLTLTAIKYKLKTPAELNDYSSIDLDTMKVSPQDIEYTSDMYVKDKIGLSAQEVQLVYPELVKENSNGYLSLNYNGLIPVLIEAIKEQDEAIQSQEKEIAILREEIEKLKIPESTK